MIRPLLLTAALLSAGLDHAWAQSASVSQPNPVPPAAKPAAPPTDAPKPWPDQVKQPVPWFAWGMDFRARNEYYDNIVSLTDDHPLSEQDLFRFRGRLWTALKPLPELSVNTRVSAEPRLWMNPAFVGSYYNQTGMEWRYGLVDNLNVKYDTPSFTVTAGRQDIVLGDFWNWWLVADGTPLDGSWSYYLDSVRVTWAPPEIKTKFDYILIHQQADASERIPTINNKSPYVTEQDEMGLILYASNQSVKNTRIDGYFIYKRDERVRPNGDDANIYTVGTKVTGNPWTHWSYSVEGGYQFGDKTDPTLTGDTSGLSRKRDLRAFGVNTRLSYLLGDRLNNQFSVIYEYLSGDDPNTTGRDEMFDVLWGRWPRWSELYIYSYLPENSGKIAQLNNIQRVGAGWNLNPIKGLTVGAYYNALFAPESVPTRAGGAIGLFSETGNFRGHFLQAVATHTFNRHVRGHLWSEFVWQGDYYAQRDTMTFLRAEISIGL
jgi:hypothetical protein